MTSVQSAKNFEATLQQASEVVFSAPEPDKLPAVIVEVAMKIMDADDASIMLCDDNHRLNVAYSSFLDPQTWPENKNDLRQSIADCIVRDKKPMILSDDVEKDRRFSGIESFRHIHSSIVYPLLSGQRVLGVLNLNRTTHQEKYSKSDLNKATILASHVVLALENSRLFGELNQRIRQLEETQARLVASERLATIGQVAACIVHEINNPVAYLQENLKYIRTSIHQLKDNTQQNFSSSMVQNLISLQLLQAIDDAQEGIQRIKDIAQDMRTLSKQNDNDMQIFDLNEAIRSAIRITSTEVLGKTKLQLELTPNCMILGSKGQLSQVFVNMIMNSTQAMQRDEASQNTITIHTKKFEQFIIAEIQDNGNGIALEHIQHIFEPFFTTKPPQSGTGLGLYICQEIIKKHGGLIEVHSERHHGTSFKITLPYIQHTQQNRENPHQIGMITSAKKIPHSLNRISSQPYILFVDDEIGILRAYQRYFDKKYQILCAETGKAALKMIHEYPNVSAIVCDILMPELDGLSFYAIVQQKFIRLLDKIIFVTGSYSQNDVGQFLKNIPNIVIEKPFDFLALDEKLEKIISQRGR